MDKPNPWLTSMALAFLALTAAGIVLDRNAALLATLAFLSFASILFAVLEPRLTGNVVASATSLSVTLRDRAENQLRIADLELQVGNVQRLNEVFELTEALEDERGDNPADGELLNGQEGSHGE